MGNGVRNSGLLSTILIFCAGLGCLGIRRVTAKVPFFLASFFLMSLFFSRSWLFGDTTSYCESAILPCLFLPNVVILHTVQEIFSALGMIDVFNTYINPLGKNFALDAFVHNDTYSNLSDIVYTASLSMVAFVGHTFLESSITLQVNNIPNFVCPQVGGKMFHAIFLEVTRELVARAAPYSLGVNHFELWPLVDKRPKSA